MLGLQQGRAGKRGEAPPAKRRQTQSSRPLFDERNGAQPGRDPRIDHDGAVSDAAQLDLFKGAEGT